MKTYSVRTRQSGSTLVVALLMLVVILMIGISAMISSDTQSKLTGNLQFEDVAFNFAEQALAAGENITATQQDNPNPGFTAYSNSTPCFYPIGILEARTAPDNDPLKMTWTDSNSCVAGDGGRYLIEKISTRVLLNTSSHTTGGRMSTPPVMVDTYLITTRGQSARGTTKFLQSYYSVLL